MVHKDGYINNNNCMFSRLLLFIKNKENTESNKIKSHTDLNQFGKEDRINSFKINLNNEKLVPLLLLSISFLAGLLAFLQIV